MNEIKSFSTKTISLTDDEKKLIKTALYFVYDHKLEQVRINHKIITEAERAEVLKTANKYFDLTGKFN